MKGLASFYFIFCFLDNETFCTPCIIHSYFVSTQHVRVSVIIPGINPEWALTKLTKLKLDTDTLNTLGAA